MSGRLPVVPVPPATARRRARWGTGITWVVVVVLIVVGGRSYPGTAWIVGVIFAFVLVGFVPFQSWGFRHVLHGADLRFLTARTASGRRTVSGSCSTSPMWIARSSTR